MKNADNMPQRGNTNKKLKAAYYFSCSVVSDESEIDVIEVIYNYAIIIKIIESNEKHPATKKGKNFPYN